MAVLIGGITARATVENNSGLELGGAWGVHALTIGDGTYVYGAGLTSDGISAFRLGSDGSLANIQNIADNGSLELDGASNFTSATVGGNTFLYVNGVDDDGISAFKVAADGTLSNIQNITDGGALELDGARGRMATATVDGASYLIASGWLDSGLSVFRINSNGTLSNTDNETDGGSLELAGAWDTATATVGGHSFVVAAGLSDDGLSVFELSGSGTLTNTDNVTDDDSLSLDGALCVATATVDGTTYVVASGYLDRGLSVFSLDGSGRLTNRSNLSDDASRGLLGANSLTTFTLDEETFVVASGARDNALAVFHLGADGTLTDVTTVFNTGSTALATTFGNAFVSVDGVPLLIAAGFNDNGITSFDIGSGDDKLVGSGESDTLLGLAGDDLLNGGEGKDEMIGGSGDDTYVVDSKSDTVEEHDSAGTDTVQASIDYALGDDVENLELLGKANIDGTGNGGKNDLTGNGGKNELAGKGGKDHLDGGGGNDHLLGGKKADVLLGGKGKDVMDGQGGNDDFVFASLKDSGVTDKTRDHIENFGGKDDLVLTDIDAVKSKDGDQDFRLDQDGNFEAGEIRFHSVSAGLIVELSVDNDAKPEMSILLEAFHGTLNNSDFEF